MTERDRNEDPVRRAKLHPLEEMVNALGQCLLGKTGAAGSERAARRQLDERRTRGNAERGLQRTQAHPRIRGRAELGSSPVEEPRRAHLGGHGGRSGLVEEKYRGVEGSEREKQLDES